MLCPATLPLSVMLLMIWLVPPVGLLLALPAAIAFPAVLWAALMLPFTVGKWFGPVDDPGEQRLWRLFARTVVCVNLGLVGLAVWAVPHTLFRVFPVC